MIFIIVLGLCSATGKKRTFAAFMTADLQMHVTILNKYLLHLAYPLTE